MTALVERTAAATARQALSIRNTPAAGRSQPRLLQEVREFPEQLAVELALERHDQVGKLCRLDPPPLAELGVLGVDVDVGIGAEEAREEPVLVLPLPLAAPQFVPD